MLTQERRLIRKHLLQHVTGVDIEMSSGIRLHDPARRFPRNVDRQLWVGLGVLLGDAYEQRHPDALGRAVYVLRSAEEKARGELVSPGWASREDSKMAFPLSIGESCDLTRSAEYCDVMR